MLLQAYLLFKHLELLLFDAERIRGRFLGNGHVTRYHIPPTEVAILLSVRYSRAKASCSTVRMRLGS